MQAQWRNAARTILALTDSSGHVVIVEPGHTLWPAASARRDISAVLPDRQPAAEIRSQPDPSPEERRAALRPLTRRQVFIALHRLELISASEAVAAAATGAVPAAMEPLFAALPKPDQTDARVTFAAFQMAHRLDPMTAMIAASTGLSDARIDAIWTTFASV